MQRYKILFGKISLVVKTVKATVIGLVANSLPGNEVILLTLLISKRYIPYTDLRKISGISAELQQINATGFDN